MKITLTSTHKTDPVTHGYGPGHLNRCGPTEDENWDF
jgi:hypothetical protein